MAEGWTTCSLDTGGCLSLDQILHSFSAAISEEHAWAIIHQSLVCLSKVLEDLSQSELLYPVTSTSHILIGSDGNVHRDSFTKLEDNRCEVFTESKVVAELGMVIFKALDFGLKTHEERSLSPALENVIDIMTSEDIDDDEEPDCEEEGGHVPDSDDEGIEKDQEEQHQLGKGKEKSLFKKTNSCTKILELCRHHLAVSSEADGHFKAVCRALVSEALELSSFMEKVSRSKSENMTDSELQELKLQDWARLWVQVIQELRTGIKLKKTEYTRTPIEYELTPYEILMDDIRSRRYKLNKVMVEGRLPPQMKKDAHDIILEFIRSRPPLKPVGERKLSPGPRKQSTPVELLMESIRSESSRSMLRKTAGPPDRPLVITGLKTTRSKSDTHSSPLPSRRVIQPDQELMDSLLNFSDDDEEDSDNDEDRSDEDEDDDLKEDETKENPGKWKKKLALDLIMHGPPLTPANRRRHSVSVCETLPTFAGAGRKPPKQRSLDNPALAAVRIRAGERKMGLIGPNKHKISVDLEMMEAERVATRCTGSASSHSKSSSMSDDWEDERLEVGDGKEWLEDVSKYSINTPEMHANLHSEFMHSEQWMTALKTLELSLDEVVHIRSVLTRAELDALPLDNNLKYDVAKGKVCFLCMKTRFSLFSWSVRCQLCSQSVCNKCSSKMRIPLEHFSSMPVFALSPSSPPPHGSQPSAVGGGSLSAVGGPPSRPASSVGFKERLPSEAHSLGSAPVSPVVQRRRQSELASVVRGSSSTLDRGLFSRSGGRFSLSNGGSSSGSNPGPMSLPVFTSQGPTTVTARLGSLKRVLSREDTRSRRESIEGTPLNVCTDCREMVLQVVRSQKTARRLEMTRSLFLNLSAVYKEEIYST